MRQPNGWMTLREEERMRARQSGFTLIELLIAMIVTFIISGAIYGLLASGQSAFRREPELSDRQQNIRLAMDMIQRDIARAGLGLPAFVQAFATPLDGGAGNPDALEIIAGVDNCPPVAVCKAPVAGTVATVELPSSQPVNSACPGLPRLVAIAPGPTADPNRELFVIGDGGTPAPTTVCTVGPVPMNPGLNPGPSAVGVQVTVSTQSGPVTGEWHPPGGVLNSSIPQLLVPVDVVRYQIAPDPNDPADPNIPCLWRSITGGRPGPAYTAVDPIPTTGTWQMVARGIEDMQVIYSSVNPAAPTTTDDAPVVVLNNYATLVFQVQVTLSARVGARNLQGESVAFGSQRIRGQLTSAGAPRAALVAFTRAGGATLWN